MGATISCNKCGKKNASHYKFCLGCGADISGEAKPEPSAPKSEVRGVVCAKCGKENQSHYKFCLGCGTEIVEAAAKGAPIPPTGRAREQRALPGLKISKDESSLWIKYTIPGWKMPLFYLLFGLACVMGFGPAFVDTTQPIFFNLFMFVGFLFGAASLFASYLTFPRPWFLSLKRPRSVESQDPFRQDHRPTPPEILIESGFLFRRRISVSTHGLKQVSTLTKTRQGPSESAAFNHHVMWHGALWDVIAQFEDGRSVVLLPMIGSLEAAQTIEFLLKEALSIEGVPSRS